MFDKTKNSALENEIERARDLYQSDRIEIDDDAQVQLAGDGNWVEAWVFVPHDEEAHQ